MLDKGPVLFKSKIKLDEMDGLIYYMCEGKVYEREEVLNMSEKAVNDWYYLKRVEELNKMKYDIDYLEKRAK